MLFNSWSFAVFLPVVFLLHYAGRRVVWQVGVLTLASFAFYGWDNPRLLPLLLLSTLVNGIAAQILLTPENSESRRRWTFRAALCFNLGALGFFKCAPLFGPMLISGLTKAQVEKAIPLPIGISFYTFQGISLVCEAWWSRGRGIPGLAAPRPEGGVKAVGWFHAKIWFFKAFFPQLISGPIVKAQEFLYQIEAKSLRAIDWDYVVRKLTLGFFLKMVVADNLLEGTSALKYPTFNQLTGPSLLLMLYGFSCQLYADFAGYSYIAQGLAKIFGYTLPDNFHHPYLSSSLTEFWRRWHLSLSSWLREYLYLPLGGNRCGAGRTYLNLFLVMFLGGLWHGGAWSYAAWGTAHGVGLALERWTGWGRARSEGVPWTLGRVLRVVLTFHLVSVLWLLFKFDEFSHVIAFGRALVFASWGWDRQFSFLVVLFSLPVMAQHLWSVVCRPAAVPGRFRAGGWLECVGYAVMLVLIVVNSGSPGKFVYFQF